MEVLGLWVAAAVGIAAINSSSRDSREQLRAIRGQLDEMQLEGRAWVGPAGALLASKDANEPLKVTLSFRNYGRQPATFVRSGGVIGYIFTEAGVQIQDFSAWKNPTLFHPQSTCQNKSSYQTIYPGDSVYSTDETPGASPLMGDDGRIVSVQRFRELVALRQRVLLIYGCFTYVTEGKNMFTTFCLLLDPGSSQNSDINTWQFKYCPYGNENGEMTEDGANRNSASGGG
jgi:hypothetical protein